MRYQQQQKGLFTFYKEQEVYELQLEDLKRKKKEEQLQKTRLAKQNSSMSHYNVSKSSYPVRYYKISSQPSFQDEDAEYNKSKITKYQQIGNSIIIINRKLTEEKDYIKTNREQIYQQRLKQQGYFLENKSMEFIDKKKPQSPLIFKKRKRSYRRKIDNTKLEQKEKKDTKLPAIMKAQQFNIEEREMMSYRSRIYESPLRYNGGNIMRYIRSNLQSENHSNKIPQKSVSFIQFSQSYDNQNSPKKLSSLNEEQKRLLDVLCRYRKRDK